MSKPRESKKPTGVRHIKIPVGSKWHGKEPGYPVWATDAGRYMTVEQVKNSWVNMNMQEPNGPWERDVIIIQYTYEPETNEWGQVSL